MDWFYLSALFPSSAAEVKFFILSSCNCLTKLTLQLFFFLPLLSVFQSSSRLYDWNFMLVALGGVATVMFCSQVCRWRKQKVADGTTGEGNKRTRLTCRPNWLSHIFLPGFSATHSQTSLSTGREARVGSMDNLLSDSPGMWEDNGWCSCVKSCENVDKNQKGRYGKFVPTVDFVCSLSAAVATFPYCFSWLCEAPRVAFYMRRGSTNTFTFISLHSTTSLKVTLSRTIIWSWLEVNRLHLMQFSKHNQHFHVFSTRQQ